MKNVEYQKIKLYSSKNYSENQDFFNIRKDSIEKIVKENNIEYALEIEEKYGPGDAPKSPKKIYTLNLVIKKEDLIVVENLLDELYQFEYEIIEPEIVEVQEEVISNEEDTNGEAIKKSNTINESKITFKEKLENLDSLGKFCIGFAILIYAFLIIFEVALIAEAGVSMGIIIAMLIETYIFFKAVKGVINKKGE